MPENIPSSVTSVGTFAPIGALLGTLLYPRDVTRLDDGA